MAWLAEGWVAGQTQGRVPRGGPALSLNGTAS